MINYSKLYKKVEIFRKLIFKIVKLDFINIFKIFWIISKIIFKKIIIILIIIFKLVKSFKKN